MYQTLDPTNHQIRPLYLLPGTEGSSVKMTLKVCNLHSEPPSYEASSGKWGNNSGVNQLKVISLDGELFCVHENLFNASQCLRSRTESHIPWIDAICIN